MQENKPWGSLKGVHPTKLARNLIENEGVDRVFINEILTQRYGVQDKKAKLVARVIQNQRQIIKNDVNMHFYVNIPICPTRCAFCSFISAELKDVQPILDEYLDCLIKEIQVAKNIITKKPYVIRSVYVGGGTPTILSAKQLERLLGELTYPVNEFTVECGRPETITREKLEVMKRMGVTRICINPQTFTQRCLKNVGRKHTNQDVLEAYKLAMEFGFRVNMDLIAGLEGETLRTFKKSLAQLMEYSPENITIHTLALKKGSLLQNEDIRNFEVEQMIDYAHDILIADGYKPYYMYRLKNQLGGLENVGYCKDGTQCLYNIDSMEETASIMACGAHAISKRVSYTENKIERQANTKFIHDYIRRIDEMIANKIEIFK